MKRREQREVVFRLVFRIPFCGKEDMTQQTDYFMMQMEEQDEDLLPDAAKHMYGRKKDAPAGTDAADAGTPADEASAVSADANADVVDKVEFTPEDEEYVRKETEGILAHLPEIDEKIEEKSRGWEIDRFGKAELAILRVAAYELMFDEEIPPSVAVNEAVEMAKRYCDEKARPFVNGVLSGLMNELQEK